MDEVNSKTKMIEERVNELKDETKKIIKIEKQKKIKMKKNY